jgi:hypothetical protein
VNCVARVVTGSLDETLPQSSATSHATRSRRNCQPLQLAQNLLAPRTPVLNCPSQGFPKEEEARPRVAPVNWITSLIAPPLARVYGELGKRLEHGIANRRQPNEFAQSFLAPETAIYCRAKELPIKRRGAPYAVALS